MTQSEVIAAPALFNHGPFLGPYTLLARTASDGRSELYRAQDTRVDQPVFIKIMANDPARRETLLRNAPRAASFSHPGIARLLELGEDNAQEWLFVISAHVSGDSLRSVMVRRRYTARRSIALAIQLADAIADAHAADLIHGDLSPDDIFVTPRGDGKILHMGLVPRRAGNLAPPADGYASPERILGESIHYSTDVYSLGAILFEMLIGRPPSVGPPVDDVEAQMNAHLHLPVGFGSRVSTDLRRTVANALALNLNARCGSAAAFAAELRAIAAILGLRSRAGV